jgi:hypothetical protein
MERKYFEVATSSGKIRDLRKSLAMYSEVFVPGIRLDDQLIKRIYQQLTGNNEHRKTQKLQTSSKMILSRNSVA